MDAIFSHKAVAVMYSPFSAVDQDSPAADPKMGEGGGAVEIFFKKGGGGSSSFKVTSTKQTCQVTLLIFGNRTLILSLKICISISSMGVTLILLLY